MTVFSDKFNQQLIIQKLELRLDALEQRIVDKDELIKEIKDQHNKFESQLVKLIEVLLSKNASAEVETASRDKFLINKATEIVTKHNEDNRYEESVLSAIRNEISNINPLSSYNPESISLDAAASEIDFYTADREDTISKDNVSPEKTKQKTMAEILTMTNRHGLNESNKSDLNLNNESHRSVSKNPFQKTIDRIKVSVQKPADVEELSQPPDEQLTDSRGDQLDEFINNSLTGDFGASSDVISDGRMGTFRKPK